AGTNYARVSGCMFIGNSAPYGGALRNGQNPYGVFTNCTFFGNTADYGGAIWNSDCGVGLANCIIWGNTATSFGGIANDNGTVSVAYSDVQGTGLIPGDGNINADPLLLDPLNGDLRLQPTSPCVSAGSNPAVLATGVTTDLDGNPR